MSADGTHEVTWHYERGGTSAARTITVTDHEDHVVIHSFDYRGFESETQWLDTATSSPSKVVETSWDGGDAGELPGTIVTHMDGYNQKVVNTWTLEGWRYFLTESTQSDWYTGSTEIPLTKTIYTPKTFSTQPLIDLLTEEVELQQWDGSSYVTQGKTHYEFDEGTLASVSGTVPHHHAPIYSRRNNLTTVRRYWGSGSSSHVEEHFSYDELGNLVDQEDIRGFHTTFDFTDNFSGSTSSYNSYAFPTQVTDALGHHIATAVYNYDTGLPVSATDQRDKTTSFTYDNMNRPLEINGPVSESKTEYHYTDGVYPDSAPSVVFEVTVASGKKLKSITTFDALGRTIRTKTIDPDGDSSVDTQYDGNGLEAAVSDPYRSGAPAWTQTSYDVLGRPTSLTRSDSMTPIGHYTYSGNVVSKFDSLDNEWKYTSNALGQLTKVEEPNPFGGSTPIETDYTYYVFGPLHQVVHHYLSSSGTLTRTYNADWLGRVTSEYQPESDTSTLPTFSYTYNGQLVQTRTDARGITTTYGYDEGGRIKQVSYDDSLTPQVNYTYDATGQSGLLSSVSVTGVTGTSYGYDDAGRVTSQSVTFSGVSGTFSAGYSYDLAGRLLQVTYPSGRAVTQSYAVSSGTAGGRLSGMTDVPTSATLVQSTANNAAGLLTSRTLSSGIAETRSYNSRNQLTHISTAAGGSSLLDLGYGYGTTNNGRIQSRIDGIQQEHSANYTYDAVGRLTEASNNSAWGIEWQYDEFGNRTHQTPSGLLATVLGTTNESYVNNQKSGGSETYDDSGNLTYDGLNHFNYDAANRIYQIGSPSIQYAYDDQNRRIKKIAGGVTTYYFYGMTGLMSEFSTSSEDSNHAGAASSDRLQYRTGEQTGTGVLMMAPDGTPRENNRVLPFGEQWTGFTASDNKEKFTTYQRDGESTSGLDYAMARHYMSLNGRFLSPDPGHMGADSTNPQSWNAYLYASNDPINSIDSNGGYSQRVGSVDTCELGRGAITAVYFGVYRFGESGPLIYNDTEPTGYDCEFPENSNDNAAVGQGQVPAGALGRALLDEAYTKAQTGLIRPMCANLFNTTGNGVGPSSILWGLFNDPHFGRVEVGGFPATSMIINNVRVNTTPNATMSNGPLFGFNANGDRIVTGFGPVLKINERFSGNAGDLAATLAHETGHTYNLFPFLGTSRIILDNNSSAAGVQASIDNQNLIRNNCRF